MILVMFLALDLIATPDQCRDLARMFNRDLPAQISRQDAVSIIVQLDNYRNFSAANDCRKALRRVLGERDA